MKFGEGPRFKNFQEFWPYYLAQHQHPSTRVLHLLALVMAFFVVVLAFVLRRPALLGIALVAGYGPAWLAHFFIEKNAPATWGHPFYSLRADCRMFVQFVRGLFVKRDGKI